MWIFHYVVLHRTKMQHKAPHQSSPSICVNSSCSWMEQLPTLLFACWQTVCGSGCGTRFFSWLLASKVAGPVVYGGEQRTSGHASGKTRHLGDCFKALKQVLEASASWARDLAVQREVLFLRGSGTSGSGLLPLLGAHVLPGEKMDVPALTLFLAFVWFLVLYLLRWSVRTVISGLKD